MMKFFCGLHRRIETKTLVFFVLEEYAFPILQTNFALDFNPHLNERVVEQLIRAFFLSTTIQRVESVTDTL